MATKLDWPDEWQKAPDQEWKESSKSGDGEIIEQYIPARHPHGDDQRKCDGKGHRADRGRHD
jgi:hypothetical protein